MDKILYGAAYYDEYMPCERLDEDMKLIKAAGMNVIRTAESTWGTLEPQQGVFDFHHIDRVLAAAKKYGLQVIVGTPTYALPTWLARMCPEVLAVTNDGPEKYGKRQNMDITNPVYREQAEIMIRALIEHVAADPCVIGYQLDNETKYYDNANERVQKMFVQWLQKKFSSLDELNAAYGLNYWSNRINSWEDFPDVRGTINGSLAAAFDEFRRGLVNEFLLWQRQIIDEYRRPNQFVTHNFDYEWRGYSFGIQPQVNHFEAADAVTMAGVDIYHPTQSELTGTEIAFGGDVSRSLKQKNYLVLETEAQGFPQWTPYPGQLRLQAFSHFASGADAVMYWHWHSLHNSFETYWKGILSHDLQPGRIYKEIQTIGKDLQRIGDRIVNLQKNNHVAILVSNESLSALEHYPIGDVLRKRDLKYNDIVRWCYDAFYRNNIECDFLSPQANDIELANYDLIVVPALYSAPETLLKKLKDYVATGGRLLATFKSFFTDENVKVYHDAQPHLLNDVFGATYQEFTDSPNVKLKGIAALNGAECSCWEELLLPTTAKVLADYDHNVWKDYAAVTENEWGKGKAWYLGCYFTQDQMNDFVHSIIAPELPHNQQQPQFPIIIRQGRNEFDRQLTYILNYSSQEQIITYQGNAGTELLNEQGIQHGDQLQLKPWDVKIIESV